MRVSNLVVGSAIAICAISADSAGQATLREGMKVRITSTSGPRVTGVVQQVTPDSVFVFTDGVGARYGIARSKITATQISEGKSMSRGALKGLAWGTGVMGAIGGLIVVTVGKDDEFERKYGDGDSPGEFFVNGVVAGAMFGPLIGAFVKSENWTDLSVQPVVGTHAVGMRVAFSF